MPSFGRLEWSYYQVLYYTSIHRHYRGLPSHPLRDLFYTGKQNQNVEDEYLCQSFFNYRSLSKYSSKSHSCDHQADLIHIHPRRLYARLPETKFRWCLFPLIE